MNYKRKPTNKARAGKTIGTRINCVYASALKCNIIHNKKIFISKLILQEKP